METPRFNKYIKDLGFKLRDAVAQEDGLADGLFSLDQKIEYLNRGYSSLKRKLSSILLKPEKVFPDYYNSVVKVIDITEDTLLSSVTLALSDIFTDEYLFEPKDIYAYLYANEIPDGMIKIPGPLDKSNTNPTANVVAIQIGEINPENYFGTKFNANDIYAPNDDNWTYFFSVINGNLVFAAGTTKKVWKLEMFVVNYTKEFKSSGGADLYLPRIYNDLFLTISAYEAMIDKGDSQSIQKATLYAGYIKNELTLIALRERKRREQEDDRTN